MDPDFHHSGAEFTEVGREWLFTDEDPKTPSCPASAISVLLGFEIGDERAHLAGFFTTESAEGAEAG
jgi:hypothetical protein